MIWLLFTSITATHELATNCKTNALNFRAFLYLLQAHLLIDLDQILIANTIVDQTNHRKNDRLKYY